MAMRRRPATGRAAAARPGPARGRSGAPERRRTLCSGRAGLTAPTAHTQPPGSRTGSRLRASSPALSDVRHAGSSRRSAASLSCPQMPAGRWQATPASRARWRGARAQGRRAPDSPASSAHPRTLLPLAPPPVHARPCQRRTARPCNTNLHVASSTPTPVILALLLSSHTRAAQSCPEWSACWGWGAPPPAGARRRRRRRNRARSAARGRRPQSLRHRRRRRRRRRHARAARHLPHAACPAARRRRRRRRGRRPRRSLTRSAAPPRRRSMRPPPSACARAPQGRFRSLQSTLPRCPASTLPGSSPILRPGTPARSRVPGARARRRACTPREARLAALGPCRAHQGPTCKPACRACTSAPATARVAAGCAGT
jgi:hypothetical protein